MFTNPVRGFIHAKSWSRPSGNHEPMVTQTTQDHINRNAHVGIDIGQAGCGYPILAAEAGTVRYAQADPATGTKVIILQHADYLRTAYEHMSIIGVRVGQVVARGQEIGKSGDTGVTAVGCHLHFEVRKRNALLVYVAQKDAWHYLAQNRVRVAGEGVTIRSAPKMADAYRFAIARSTGLIRLLDGKVLAPLATYMALQGDGAHEPWFGWDEYDINGVKGTMWAPAYLDGAYRDIAKPLVVRGAAN